jgi:hypothetical protein
MGKRIGPALLTEARVAAKSKLSKILLLLSMLPLDANGCQLSFCAGFIV